MKKHHIITLHSAFWIVVLFINFSFLFFGEGGAESSRYLARAFKSILEFVDFYLIYFLLAPRLHTGRNFVSIGLLSILFLAAYITFYAFSISFIYIQMDMAPGWGILKTQFIVAVYYTTLYAILGWLFRMTIDGLMTYQRAIELEKQNSRNELALLRSQVNPHFLFNSLNTIHSYILSKNPNSASAVIGLSDIMRYMLYEASRDRIPLQKELDHLQSYIRLQDYRIEKEGFVEFNINGDPDGIQIPPMLFIPFVENAFKHGSTKVESPGVIINLNISTTSLHINVSNRCRDSYHDRGSGGEAVGLKNVRRRLELLFPERHELEITSDHSTYTVALTIKLQ